MVPQVLHIAAACAAEEWLEWRGAAHITAALQRVAGLDAAQQFSRMRDVSYTGAAIETCAACLKLVSGKFLATAAPSHVTWLRVGLICSWVAVKTRILTHRA